MSDITHGKDLVDSLKEPVVEDPIALCAEAAAEIERLRASESQAIADADALALEHCTRMAYLVEKAEGIQSGAAWRAWLKARPAIDPALRRAAERRKAKGGG